MVLITVLKNSSSSPEGPFTLASANFGKGIQAAQMIADARAEGLDVTYDVYPYTAYGSGLIDILPP